LTISFSLSTKLLPIAAACLGLALPAFAQTTAPAFDVVSIKPYKSSSPHSEIHRTSELFSALNLSIKTLIMIAYDLKTEDQISAMPGWGNSAHYDIEAKADAETMAALKAMPEEAREQASDTMLQAMLADRFQLKVHHETRELPTYSLVVAKGGLKLKQVDRAVENDGSMYVNRQDLTATGISISRLCGFLSQQSHRKVEDKTGLLGRYDLTLKWAPDEIAGQQDANGDVMPSLFTALQEQLGLKVESTKGPVDTIVIDHVEQPTDN
jgi:uncharacterized protein (TIGR03435 family)